MVYYSSMRNITGTPKVNKAAKSLLAKLLATEGIRVVHSTKVTTAMWTARTKTLTLPVWKQMTGDIYDRLVCHEVGHARYSPDPTSSEWKTAQSKIAQGKPHLMESAFAFMNICEDARIEKKMKLRYPGSRRSFYRGFKWMLDSGTLKLPADLNQLKYIDRVNLHFKMGPLATERFNGIAFDSREQALVDRLANVGTAKEMYEIAEAMYRLAQEQKENEQKPRTNPHEQDCDCEDGENGEPGDGEQGGGQKGEAKQGSADPNIPDEPNEDDTDPGSMDDDTDDGSSADSTDGDGNSDGKGSDDDGKTDGSDGKGDRNKPDTKDESSDDEADGQSSESGDGSDNGADSAGKANSGDNDSDGDDGDESGNGSGDGDGDGDTESKAKSGHGAGAGQGQGEKDTSLVAPDSPTTQDGLDNAIQNLVDRNATERVYVNVPKMILKHIIQDHKELHAAFKKEMSYHYDKGFATATRSLARFEKEAKPAVNTMGKRFDLMKAADAHKREQTSKTGRIDPNMLHAYKLTEDIFKRATMVPDGKNHGLVMFIDWSTSMEGNISKTIKQLLNLVMFCRRVNIPFEVFGFSDRDSNTQPMQVAKTGDFRLSPFQLHNWLSGRMTAGEFKRAMTHVMMLVHHFGPGGGYNARYSRRYPKNAVMIPNRLTLGGTPLDDAIAAALEIVPAFQKANDVQIVNTIFLTDGASGGSPIFHHDTHGAHNADIIVHDPITKGDYALSDFDANKHRSHYGYGNRSATNLLLTMLRDRTDSNVIGFYLFGKSYRNGGYTKHDVQHNLGVATTEEVEREWKRFQKDKFAIATSAGYSEYFLIPADLEAKTEEMKDASGASFAAMNRSRIVNRVMLNRFIDMIAKERS